jgi:hypothetical protein
MQFTTSQISEDSDDSRGELDCPVHVAQGRLRAERARDTRAEIGVLPVDARLEAACTDLGFSPIKTLAEMMSEFLTMYDRQILIFKGNDQVRSDRNEFFEVFSRNGCRLTFSVTLDWKS